MPFVEIQPLKARGGDETGVVVNISEARGLSVSLSGDALAALGKGPTRVRAAIDADPVSPRLRLTADASGPYPVSCAPLGDRVKIVRVGVRTELPMPVLKGFACTWEAGGGRWRDCYRPAA